MADLPAPDARDRGAGGLDSFLDEAPERLLVEIVGRGERLDTVALGVAQETARRALLDAAVDPADRLEAETVAQRQHVQRQLQTPVPAHVGGALGVRRLVVVDQATGRRRIDVDAVDAARHREAAEIERIERLLQIAGLEAVRQLGLAAHEGCELAAKAVPQLGDGQRPGGQRERVDRQVDGADEQLLGGLEQLGHDAVRADLGRQPLEEVLERRVHGRARDARVDRAIDLARLQHAVDEPALRAVGERLELGRAEVALRAVHSARIAGSSMRVTREKARRARSILRRPAGHRVRDPARFQGIAPGERPRASAGARARRARP